MNVCGILLAAGASSRFGSDKLLQPLPDGTPIGVASARVLRASLPQSLAVVGDINTRFARQLAGENMTLAPCPRAVDGMGVSITCGVKAASDADAWVIALADMPFIQQPSIDGVAAALREGAPLVAPQFDGKRGHPVGFGAGFRDQLLQLTGDTGARDILNSHQRELRLIPVDDAGVLRDIDYSEDL